MEPISIVGAFLVTMALLAYGVGSITLHRFKMVGKIVLSSLTLGILLDITAFVCMIIGSQNTPFTLHGFLGYSAFLVMLIDLILLWRAVVKSGVNTTISKSLHLYARLAYSWWVVAYLTGSLLIIF